MMKYLISILSFLLLGSIAHAQQLHEDLSLKYLVKEPAGANKQMPLIVLLHGYGSNEAELFELKDALPANFIVVSARAPKTLGKGAYQWYELAQANGKSQPKETDLKESRDLIIRFVQEIISRYHADPQQVFLSGFSQGAIMSYEAGLTHPELFKGIAPLSGRIYPSLQAQVRQSIALKKLWVFIGHGDADQRIPYSDAAAAFTYLKSLQLRPEFKTYKGMGHSISSEEMKDLVQWLQQP